MVYSGFEYSTIFSQNYQTNSITIIQYVVRLVLEDYTKMKMDTNYQNYVQMQLYTSSCTIDTSFDVNKPRIVD